MAPSTPRAKPKRPLSGYNLFYRYKRNKVLEATACLRRGGAPGPGDDACAVEDVLRAPPGLEGVPPDHAIWSLPPASIDKVRGSNIRSAMDGRLFPNEDVRSRLHRKVHGMGFVEMGRVMRETWAGADAFSKSVFCELADVGRVRYRMLLAEYKLMRGQAGTLVEPEQLGGPDPAPATADAPVASLQTVPTIVYSALTVAPSGMETPLDVLPNHGVLGFPSSVVDGQRAAIQAGIAPLCPLPGPRVSSEVSGLLGSRRALLPPNANNSLGSHVSPASVLGLSGSRRASLPADASNDPPDTSGSLDSQRRATSGSLGGIQASFVDFLRHNVAEGCRPLGTCTQQGLGDAFRQHLENTVPRLPLVGPVYSLGNASSNVSSASNVSGNMSQGENGSNNIRSIKMSLNNMNFTMTPGGNSSGSQGENSSNSLTCSNNTIKNMNLALTKGPNSCNTTRSINSSLNNTNSTISLGKNSSGDMKSTNLRSSIANLNIPMRENMRSSNISSSNTSSNNMNLNISPEENNLNNMRFTNLKSTNTNSNNMNSTMFQGSHLSNMTPSDVGPNNKKSNVSQGDNNFNNTRSCDMSPNNTNLTTSQGESSYHEIIYSGRALLNNIAGLRQVHPLTDRERAVLSGVEEPLPEPAPRGDATTRDFLELIGTLDEALDDCGANGIGDSAHMMDETADGRSSPFLCKPMADDMLAGAAAMPDSCVPNNFGARTA